METSVISWLTPQFVADLHRFIAVFPRKRLKSHVCRVQASREPMERLRCERNRCQARTGLEERKGYEYASGEFMLT